jgi:predicted flap endonuclease-1-like 5' DNA nuclease
MIALFSFSFCDTWWLAWLLPFLIGLGIGWLFWGKFKDMVESLEAEVKSLRLKIQGLEADLAACKSARSEADGNVALLRGRIREMEAAGTIKSGAVKVDKAAASIAAGVASKTIVSGSADSEDKWFAAIGTGKLQIIEGIGPKMEEVLIENGINDFNALAVATPASLRTILDKYGDKYRIIDPNTWPQQAALANSRSWNDLISLQKTLDTGRSDTVTDGHTDSKLEKWLIKAGVIRRWSQDDLKAVEGIGPKIESLLHDAGIKTWRALADTPVSRIQDILTAAGPRFALADPGTWPKQSELAADGKWDELNALQDALNAGKLK